MTFGPNHYVPVLKVKRGEKAALRSIASSLHVRITPLLQIVERTPDKSLEKHVETAFKDLATSVQPYARCFIDAREIEPDGPTGAEAVFVRAASEGIVFTPVTGVTRSVDVAAALDHRTHGIALRVTRSEVEAGNITSKIEAFLGIHGLVPSDIDMIVDVGAVEEMIPEGIAALVSTCLAEIPHQNDWRTLTVSACAFPMSMGGVERHSHDLVERAEWVAWKDSLHAVRDDLARLPAFSDYAIQHPKGVERFDPRIMQVSAAVRYTTDLHWLLVKGESTRSTRPGTQFPQIATRLVYGHLQSYFAGAAHCAGCRGIKDAADGTPKYGAPEVWRKLGTIHHISKVMQDFGALSWP